MSPEEPSLDTLEALKYMTKRLLYHDVALPALDIPGGLLYDRPFTRWQIEMV